MRYRTACIVVLLLTISSKSSAQFPWQKPLPPRSKKAVAIILGPTTRKEPSRDLNIVWVWGIDRNHEEGAHEFVKARDLLVGLLEAVPRVTIDTAKLFPTKSQWAKADLVVFYVQLQALKKEDFDLMDDYLRRGGGLIVIHAAMISSGDDVAKRFGLAWDRKTTRWGVLPIPSKVNTEIDHEIFRGFPGSIELVDELYWNLAGDLKEITVLATSQAGPPFALKGPPTSDQLDGKSWPLFWTKQVGKGRVFGSIPGHNLFTFNDAYFRIILLRAMAWTMNESFDPFKPLVTKGIKLRP